MKKYKGAVFFDIDGTLIDERIGVSAPTESTKNAISLLRKNGYFVGVATGRAKCYMCDLGIDFDCYVTCNGAVVEIGGAVVYTDYMDEKRQREMIAYLGENDFGYAFETFDKCYYGEKTKQEFFSMMEQSKLNTEHFFKLSESDSLRFCKAMITFKKKEQFDRLRENFQDDFIITQHHNAPEADINLIGVTKATGVKKALELANIEAENAYAFGDGENDIELFSTVGCGVAMTPHSPKLSSYAKKICGGVADGGISKALCELGLI